MMTSSNSDATRSLHACDFLVHPLMPCAVCVVLVQKLQRLGAMEVTGGIHWPEVRFEQRAQGVVVVGVVVWGVLVDSWTV